MLRDRPPSQTRLAFTLRLAGGQDKCPFSAAGRVGSIELLGGQHVVLRGWVLGSGQCTARTKPKRGPVRPEPDGLGRPSSLRAVP